MHRLFAYMLMVLEPYYSLVWAFVYPLQHAVMYLFSYSKLILLHSERLKLYTILAFLSAIGLMDLLENGGF